MYEVNCRFCGEKLKHIFADLGLSPLANEFITLTDLSKGQYFYPLRAYVCESCYMAQTLEFSKPKDVFSNYKYFSSYSKSWLSHCKKYADMIVAYLSLDKNSNVVEIGCNDGYLLQYFQEKNIPGYGVEPAENVALEARKKGLDVVSDFFDEGLAFSLKKSHGEADLIIGNNIIAHVPDINSFVKGLQILLSPSGCITLEFPHVLNLIKHNQFDTIYHEHYSYFSLLTLKKIFEAHALKITGVEELNTHGGSLRVYAAHAGSGVHVDEHVNSLLDTEVAFGLDKVETYTAFNEAIKKTKRDAVRILCEIKEAGGRIAAYGAAAKGNTFLNYCGIGKDFIEYVTDANPKKQGLYLPGTYIPIVGISRISETRPDYIIILPWNLSSEIKKELEFTKEWECKLVSCIPKMQIF